MKNMMVGIMALINLSTGSLFAQSTAAPLANPKFEVATIKPAQLGETLSIRVRGGQFSTTDASLIDLATFAYGLHAHQITGGPGWLETEKYDVAAVPEATSQPNFNQVRLMVQQLLADRFGLTSHRDRKELPVYVIRVAKGGPKLKESTADDKSPAGTGFNPTGEMTVRNATMIDFAGFLQRYVLDRPVIDKTAISGKYNIELKWMPDQSQFGGRTVTASTAADNLDSLPSLYSALQEQVGLKLESTKASVEVLVVDHVERPSEN